VKRVIKDFAKDKKGLLGFGILLSIVFLAVFANLVAPYNPYKMDYLERLKPPTLSHPFGTDWFGRDVLSRVIYGSRVALGIGATATIVSTLFGGLLGLLAGYFKGIVDSIIMRLFEILNSIPYFILILLIVGLFGSNVVLLILLLGLFGIRIARIARSEALAIREEDYILAAKAIAASHWRIIFRHVLPNSFAAITVVSTMQIGMNIILVAGLSFLGAGVPPPTPSWGATLSGAQEFMKIAWWTAVFPGLAIFFTVMAFNLLGDSLRDVLDPRMVHRIK